MKKEYVSPKMEISWLKGEDIIYTSGASRIGMRRMNLQEEAKTEPETEPETESITETEEETQTEVSKGNEIESMIETKGEQWSHTETESVIEKIVEDVTESFSHSWFDNDDTGNVGESVSSDVEKSDNTDRSIEYDDYDDTVNGDSSEDSLDNAASSLNYKWSDGEYEGTESTESWFEDNY
jgi:hypothetical protein